ncbi:MAG: hypothetical protein P8J32_01545 [bacterium]|nr:hypothetical protein [bacterium]
MTELETIEAVDQKELGLNIDPQHFMEFLKQEDQDIEGDYEIDCASMCEFACLYIGMMMTGHELPGVFSVAYGSVGLGGHFWVEYTVEGQTYIIDLTLRQFLPEAANLIVAKQRGSIYHSHDEPGQGQPMTEYLEEVRAFRFYIDPRTMTKPPGHMTEEQLLSILSAKLNS